jgi:hypothetical protein
MDNPLKLPRPDDALQQIHDYARDLAYLFVQGDCKPQITLGKRYSWNDNPHVEREGDSQNRIDFRLKWGDYGESFRAPSIDLLISFDYLVEVESRQVDQYTLTTYIFTPKAFQLLEKPAQMPAIFVSYSRKESSALALLIEARLRLVGADRIFIDKMITAGNDWQEQLVETIRQCTYFICLVGPTTLNSQVVNHEIAQAVESGCRIISVWHNGHKMGADSPEALRRLHAITVTGESAREYETALSELLNSMGYRTY